MSLRLWNYDRIPGISRYVIAGIYGVRFNTNHYIPTRTKFELPLFGSNCGCVGCSRNQSNHARYRYKTSTLPRKRQAKYVAIKSLSSVDV